jgi:hypothetical protein
MSFISNNVYTIKNVASGTVLDLDNGKSANGTKCQGWEAYPKSELTYDQQWLISDVQGSVGVYTLRNLRGGTYLDLSNGSSTDGTKVQGWEAASSANVKNQQWTITAEGSTGHYRLQNVAGGTYLDLDSGNSANGTKVQGWSYVKDDKNQLWDLTRVSRTHDEVQAIVDANSFTGVEFASYRTDELYVVVPDSVRQDIYNGTGLSKTSWRDQIFDCDDFAIVAKAAVAKWANGFLLADGITVLFGVMFGENISGKKHSYNWYLTQDLSSLVFFEPQNGTEVTPTGYTGYFGLF